MDLAQLALIGEFLGGLSVLLTMVYLAVQVRSGSSDEEMANTFMLGLSANFHSRGFKSFWQERNFIFTKELREWVKSVQSQPPLRPGHRTFSSGEPGPQ